MRYLWPLFLILFTYISLIFISQNSDPAVIRFQIDWLGIALSTKRPIYLPIFVTLASGVLFSVFYFFAYHTRLLVKSKWQSQEIKRLKRIVLKEREQIKTVEKQNEDLQQIVSRLENQVTQYFDENPPVALPHNPSNNGMLPP